MKYELLKKEFGRYASWACWDSNDINILPDDHTPKKPQYMFVGLNASQAEEVKQKKVQKALDKYGVDNVFEMSDVITKAVKELQASIEGLNIVYYHNGYFSDDNEIYNGLKETSPRLILVAMGSPRQEEFIYNAKQALNPALMVGIGGSLDVWSGTVKRAPEIYQKLGLEWLYRTVSQPERFKRIFPTLPLFLIKALMYKE